MNEFICDQKLRRLISANLKKFVRLAHGPKSLKRAAVAITVVDTQRDPNVHGLKFKQSQAQHAALILTKRAAKMRKHAGQWAFPGGVMERGESPQESALRELSEEVGLTLSPDRIIGRLDDYSTRSGFTITPIVVWGGVDLKLRANPEEVASIHRIPLTEFMRPDAPILEEIPESENPVLLMPVGSSWIAAPTAAMLYQFREVALLGREKRVAHYEQPYFAWQ